MRLLKERFIVVSLIAFVAWAILSLFILEAMPGRIGGKNEAPKKIVKVLMRTGVELEAMRQTIEPFEQETGIHVELIELDRDSYFTLISTQLFAGTDDFDLVFMPSTYVPQFAKVKAIVPLDPFMNDRTLTNPVLFDADDFLFTFKADEHIYALPTDISTHFLYYRSDLIPQPPETWDELLDAARKWTRANSPDSPTKWGLGMTGLAPEELPKIFNTVLWSLGGDILDEKNEVQLDSQQSIQAAEYYSRFVREGLADPDLLSMGFAETRDALIRGDVAMAAPFWNAAYPTIYNGRSPYKHSIKVALVPGVRNPDGKISRKTFQHGWGLAMNANSSAQKEAWAFLMYATGKRGGAIYARAGGTPARTSILSDPLLHHIRPEFPLVLESLKLAKEEPAVTFYPLIVRIQNEALTQLLTLHASPADAMREAAEKVRVIERKDSGLNLSE
ncbi:sugar ABC transporter substrate-binding protein [Brevibacillus choshinensis]|uniref:ABC transporter substrate-binding protein n=1 Tax=Brevibacillus choshinensis TaxID=54911 RepID=UPI002E227770|nr:sugar ABC transporter substrate-binding protein [Brevibacillus choshinensis]